MRIGNWNGLAPVTAGAALLVLALLPQKPVEISLDTPAIHEAGAIALEHEASGDAVAWDDDATGLSGRVVPLRVFRSDGGAWCRHYIVTVDEPDGAPAVISRTACRGADGHWHTIGDGARAPQIADVGR